MLVNSIAATRTVAPPQVTASAPSAAAPSAPEPAPAVAQAKAGYERIFEFDGFAAGDQFDVAKGSTAGSIGVRGDAKLHEFTPQHAKLWIKAGRFGINREADIVIDQVDATHARMTVTDVGKQPVPIELEIVEVRKNFSEFKPTNYQARNAVLQLDGSGRLVMDLEDVLTDKIMHLILEKKS